MIPTVYVHADVVLGLSRYSNETLKTSQDCHGLTVVVTLFTPEALLLRAPLKALPFLCNIKETLFSPLRPIQHCTETNTLLLVEDGVIATLNDGTIWI
jgi:hypothetical protein